MAADLTARFNLTTGGAKVWSNVDVKGFARSAVPLLRKAGVETLYVGTNGGPRPPAEARNRGLQPVVGDANATMFVWHDPPSGAEVTAQSAKWVRASVRFIPSGPCRVQPTSSASGVGQHPGRCSGVCHGSGFR